MKLYFSTEEEFSGVMRPSEEGNHFEGSLKVLNNIYGELRNKNHFYSIEVNECKSPLIIGADILYWSCPNLAELFMDKITGGLYPNPWVSEQTDINPDVVKTDKITDEDRPILISLMQEDATPESFDKIWEFIKSKGYDCIVYRIYEGGYKDRAILLNHDSNFDYSTLKELQINDQGLLEEGFEMAEEKEEKTIDDVRELTKTHNELNPKIWDEGRLKSKIKDGILKLVDAFKEYIELPLRVVDVIIVGSNAGYNYNETSDLDVHIIADFDAIDNNNGLVTALMNALKTSFNHSYDIDFCGVNVELYVEDMNTNVSSNGIYSVFKNKWIKEPVKIDYSNIDITHDLEPVEAEVIDALDSNDYEKITSTIDDLYYNRKLSIQIGGEMSLGNLIFKAIRAKGLLKQLKDKQKALKSKQLCVEKKNNIAPNKLLNESTVIVKDNCGVVLYEGLQTYEPFKDSRWVYNDGKGLFECNILGSGIFTKEIVG